LKDFEDAFRKISSSYPQTFIKVVSKICDIHEEVAHLSSQSKVPGQSIKSHYISLKDHIEFATKTNEFRPQVVKTLMSIVFEITKQVSQTISIKKTDTDAYPKNDHNNSPGSPNHHDLPNPDSSDENDLSRYEYHYCFSSVILIDILRTHILKRYPIFLPFVLKMSVGKTIQKYLTEKYFLQRLSNPAASFLQFNLRVMLFIDSSTFQIFGPQLHQDCYVLVKGHKGQIVTINSELRRLTLLEMSDALEDCKDVLKGMLSEGAGMREFDGRGKRKRYLSEELKGSVDQKNCRHKSVKKPSTNNMKGSDGVYNINQEIIRQECNPLDPEYEALRVFSKYGASLLNSFLYVPILKNCLNSLTDTNAPNAPQPNSKNPKDTALVQPNQVPPKEENPELSGLNIARIYQDLFMSVSLKAVSSFTQLSEIVLSP
jgi:hypothetical protein